MPKIIGNTTATPNPRPDWAQTDSTKADFIKNKPTVPTKTSELTNDSDFATRTEVDNKLANNTQVQFITWEVDD